MGPSSFIIVLINTITWGRGQDCDGGLQSSDEAQLVWKHPEILQTEADPYYDTIYDDYIIFFDKECIKNNPMAITEFFDLWDCYEENTESGHIDKYPQIIDHWIEMNKLSDCDSSSDDAIQIKWCDYCIYDIQEEEKITSLIVHECVSKKVEDALWNLNAPFSFQSDRTLYVEYPPLFNPNFDIIVMDSGIDTTHSEFDGITIERIENAYPNEPLHTHGTFCSAIILGKNYGAFRAKDTDIKLIDVRSLDQNGNATGQDLLNGYDAIIGYLQSNPGKKAIINLSFGGRHWDVFNVRLEQIRLLGGISFAAAGNNNGNASEISPALSAYTITVGAHDQNNQRSIWCCGFASNFGDSIDIWAPGTDIKSAVVGGGNAVSLGTSMATPLVAGIAANILANNADFNFDAIKNKLLEFAINDVNDGLGNDNLPRVQISCGEYCDESEPSCDSVSGS